jgi:transposase
MIMKRPKDEKAEMLRSRGTLHPHPERVKDDLFRASVFFDPRDAMQVRYEMLRRHRVEGLSVAATARAFGVSRQYFYLLARAFEQRGLPGLLSGKRGPKRARKCSDAVLDHAQSCRAESPALSWEELVKEVASAFGVRLHPRTLQRALARRGKKRHSRAAKQT